MNLTGRMRVGFGAGLLLLFGLVFFKNAAAEIILPQSDGSALRLEFPATRVVTLAPNIAEMMFDAGAGEVLLATVEYSNFPDAAARLPRIGDAFRFDLERIIALSPDLVIAWNSGNPSAALDRLESLGLRVWRTELRKPGDIADLLRNISIATDTGDSGSLAAQVVEQRLADLAKQYGDEKPVSYFYQVAERPLFTLNGEHIVSQALELCGGVNVFAKEPVIAPQITRESVLLADPEVLLAPRLADSPDPLAHWRSWPRLKAVRSDALHYLSADKISRATPRMLDSIELACTLLHQQRSKPNQPMEQS